MKSIREEMADSLRRVNAAYSRLRDPESVDIFEAEWMALRSAVDVAVADGDDRAARKAIKAWERHALDEFTRAEG